MFRYVVDSQIVSLFHSRRAKQLSSCASEAIAFTANTGWSLPPELVEGVRKVFPSLQGQDLTKFLFLWVACHGEAPHINSLFTTTDEFSSSVLFWCMQFLVMFEPTVRRRAIFYQIYRKLGKVVVYYTFEENELIHNWMKEVFVCGDLPRHDEQYFDDLDTLLSTALSGDSKLMYLFERATEVEHFGEDEQAEALQLLGAVRMLKGDVPSCLRLWSHYIDITGECEFLLKRSGFRPNYGGDPNPFEHLEALETLQGDGCYTLIMTALQILSSTETLLRNISEVPAYVVDTVIQLEMSARNRLAILHSLLANWPHSRSAQLMNVVRLVHATLASPVNNRCVQDFSQEDLVQSLAHVHMRVDYRITDKVGNEAWTKLMLLYVSRIDFGHFLDSKPNADLLEVLLNVLLRLPNRDTFRDSLWHDRIHALLCKGALVGRWQSSWMRHRASECFVYGKQVFTDRSSYSVDWRHRSSIMRVLDEIDKDTKELSKLGGHILLSQCQCVQLPGGCLKAIMDLRCLAAARVVQAQFSSVERQPQIWIESGRIGVTLSHFLTAHEHLERHRICKRYISKTHLKFCLAK